MAEQIGKISLYFSTALYLIYLLPQLFHNAKGLHIKKLSLYTHSILFFAYILDLLYAFGRSMPWQYKLVSCVGLLCLVVQHFQFLYFSKHLEDLDQKVLKLLSFVFIFCLGLSLYLFLEGYLTKTLFISLGFLSQLGWFTYALPQIYKNYKFKNAEGLSIYFILFILLLAFCDSLSAWLLDWDLPNKIGSPISFCIKLILLFQFFKYSNNCSKNHFKVLPEQP